MRPPLQNLTIKIALGLWEATEAVPSFSVNGNGDRSTTCFTSSSWKDVETSLHDAPVVGIEKREKEHAM